MHQTGGKGTYDCDKDCQPRVLLYVLKVLKDREAYTGGKTIDRPVYEIGEFWSTGNGRKREGFEDLFDQRHSDQRWHWNHDIGVDSI
jgi:hypothetical protein